MRNSVIIGLIILLSGAGLASAQEGETLTLDQCLTLALSQNPLLLSAREEHRAARAREAQARAIPWPSLDLDLDLQPRLFDLKNYGESYAGLSQTIEFPGKRYLRGKVAHQESRLALLNIDELRIEIVYRVSEAFLRLLLAQEKLDYDSQDLGLARDFVRLAELKFAAGDVAQVEVLRAKVEASKAANAVQASESERAQAEAALNYWLSRRSPAPLVAQGTLKIPGRSLDVERLKSRALAARPERQKIDEALRREQLSQNLSFLGYLPDLDIGVARHTIAGEPSTWDVTFSLALPLFFWQPVVGEIAEARANIAALKQAGRETENAILKEIEEAWRGALAAQRQIELFEEEILSQSEKTYSMLLLSYREGEIGGIEMIEARRTLIDARKTYADTLYNHALALAALERALGERLEGEKP